MLVLFIFFGLTTGFAQTRKALQRAADEALAAANYPLALHYYGEALAIAPDETALQYGYGVAAYRSRAYQAAADQLLSLTEETVEFPLASYYAARAVQVLGDFDQAANLYRQFVSSYPAFPEAEMARSQLAFLPEAKKLLIQAGGADTILHLGRSVNSAYSEFSPYPRGDTLLFSSYRYPVRTEGNGKEFITKVLHRTSATGRARPVGRGFNTDGRHTAHPQLSADEKRFYFTTCTTTETGIRCELAYRERNKRGTWRSTYKVLPAPINLPGATTTQPHLTTDSTGRQVLYFVSDRAGGAGGLDIYVSEKQGENWTEPKNLSAVNTPADDMSPYYDSARNELYFATSGRPGIGGIDIFAHSFYKAETRIFGASVNSTYDDLYFVPFAPENRGYLASNRPGAFYLDKTNKTCCYDLFELRRPRSPFDEAPPAPVEPPPVADLPEVPPTPTPVAPPAPVVPPRPTTLEAFLPLALYFDNDHPDPRTRRTTTTQRYAATYERYAAEQATYRREYAAGALPEARIRLEQEVDEFFAAEIESGYTDLQLFGEILLRRLEDGERVEIFVKGYTSPRAKGDYNLRLGKRRVSSVRNEFAAMDGGVFQSYLRNGQLVISEVSFGETRAAAGVSDALDDRRNSVYSPAAARERRVEIVEVR